VEALGCPRHPPSLSLARQLLMGSALVNAVYYWKSLILECIKCLCEEMNYSLEYHFQKVWQVNT